MYAVLVVHLETHGIKKCCCKSVDPFIITCNKTKQKIYWEFAPRGKLLLYLTVLKDYDCSLYFN